jgi:hypothetical protein
MLFLCKYATLLVTGTTAIRIPITKFGSTRYAKGADWTPAAGDVKILVDGAAAANVTNLPTAVASGNTAIWEFILTAAELTGKQIEVMISDNGVAVEDDGFIVQTYGNASARFVANLESATLDAATAFATALTESYRANGATGTPAQILYEMLAMLTEKARSGVSLRTNKLDHSTQVGVYTLDDATTPTSITRTT